MEWTCRLIFLLVAAPGIHSQVQLVQPGAEVKRPGESVKVSCKGSGYTFTDYAISWVKQVPGKGLQWMGWINTKTSKPTYAEGFTGRFVFSLDASVSTAYLQISSLQAEDMAVYYCMRHSVKNHILSVSETLGDELGQAGTT